MKTVVDLRDQIKNKLLCVKAERDQAFLATLSDAILLKFLNDLRKINDPLDGLQE